MNLTRNQFDVLYALSSNPSLTQRDLKDNLKIGLGTVNSVLKELSFKNLVSNKQLTSKGTEALAPYLVSNAVILAAGLSARFAPISYEKPKGLLKVRGEILIERQIEQLREVGIKDITVVVGYKQEYFFYLRKKYGVSVVVNDQFSTRNNNSSIWVVKEKLANTYICSSDNYFTDNPFTSHVYQSYYAAQFFEGETDEWCIKYGAHNRITSVTVGGKDDWAMLGHAYFNSEFSQKFVKILESVYENPDTYDKHWEAIYIDHIKDLDMVIKKYPAGFINEFDSLDELQGFDPSFIENVDSEVFDNIVKTLGCSRSDIKDFYPLKQGITNLSCHFTVAGKEYVYRHPGIGTEKIIDREAEFSALELAQRIGLDNTYLHGEPAKGWKISKFISNTRSLDPFNLSELKLAMEMSRRLHNSGETLENEFDFIEAGKGYEKALLEHGPIDVPGYYELREKVMTLKDYADTENFPIVPSHNDFFYLNFLVGNTNEVNLIDWEYAGMSNMANDFGTFTVCAQLPRELANQAIAFYFGREPTAVEHRHFWAYVVFAGWCWYVWALLKEAEGDNIGEWLWIYYKHAADYVDEILELYSSERN